jgi:2,5-diamino-6-(ribosylamino)-4(3H)-pyrimidinone 5'-phosphate reductase
MAIQKDNPRHRDLPFVYVNVATTADGKLAPANRHFTPFGSERDQKLLLELRTFADAVMSGARTVDLAPVTLGTGGEKYRRLRRKHGLSERHIRVVVSGRGTIDEDAEIFKHRFSPIVLLTTERAGRRKLQRLRKLADEVKVCGDEELDFKFALRWLRSQWNVRRLLCEGGGEINAGLFRAGVVNDIYVTLCPLLFGGRNAPTLCDGDGIAALEEAARLKLKKLKKAGDELFLVYSVIS